MLIGYSLLLRPGKVGYQTRLDEKNFYNECNRWHSKSKDPREISIEVEASKTNGWKHKTEIIHAPCNCNNPKRIIPCPVHLLKHWINLQVANHETNFKSRDLLFIHKSKKPFRCDHLNN